MFSEVVHLPVQLKDLLSSQWLQCLAIFPSNVARSLTFQHLENTKIVKGGRILGAGSLVYGKRCSFLFISHTLSHSNICLDYSFIFVLDLST